MWRYVSPWGTMSRFHWYLHSCKCRIKLFPGAPSSPFWSRNNSWRRPRPNGRTKTVQLEICWPSLRSNWGFLGDQFRPQVKFSPKSFTGIWCGQYVATCVEVLNVERVSPHDKKKPRREQRGIETFRDTDGPPIELQRDKLHYERVRGLTHNHERTWNALVDRIKPQNENEIENSTT